MCSSLPRLGLSIDVSLNSPAAETPENPLSSSWRAGCLRGLRESESVEMTVDCSAGLGRPGVAGFVLLGRQMETESRTTGWATGVGEMKRSERREGLAWARQNKNAAFTACQIRFSLIRKVLDNSFQFAIEANHAANRTAGARRIAADSCRTRVLRPTSEPDPDDKRAALDNDNGLSQVCGRLGDRKRTALPLFLWRQSRPRPLHLESVQWHPTSSLPPSPPPPCAEPLLTSMLLTGGRIRLQHLLLRHYSQPISPSAGTKRRQETADDEASRCDKSAGHSRGRELADYREGVHS